MTLVIAIIRVGAVLLVASVAGWVIAAALVPESPRFRGERLGWGVALACGLLAGFVPLTLLLNARPGWVGFLLIALLFFAVARRLARAAGGR